MSRKTLRWPLVLWAVVTLCFTGVPLAGAKPPSPADCDAYARNYARNSGSIVGKAAGGAALGGLFGAIVGKGKGAKKGVVLGALVGGVAEGARRSKVRKQAYNDCMAGRVRW